MLQGTPTPVYPSFLYAALLTSVAADDGTGATEVSGQNYNRVALPRSGIAWTQSPPGIWQNALSVTFPACSGSGYSVRQFAVYDAAVAGALKATMTLAPALSVQGGQSASFAPGNLTLRWIGSALSATSVRLSWDANDPNATGYVVHWGAQGGVYSNSLDVGPAPTALISGLTPGQRDYFSVTAYDAFGVQGPYSAELSYEP